MEAEPLDQVLAFAETCRLGLLPSTLGASELTSGTNLRVHTGWVSFANDNQAMKS